VAIEAQVYNVADRPMAYTAMVGGLEHSVGVNRMASINVNLSDELEQFVAGQVETELFAGASEYIETLIERAKEGKEKIDSLLIEGLDSGDPIPLDAVQWSRIHSEVTERISHGP